MTSMPTSKVPTCPVYTVQAAARELEVSDETIYTWLRKGKLKRVYPVAGKIVLVSAKSVARLAAKRNGVAA